MARGVASRQSRYSRKVSQPQGMPARSVSPGMSSIWVIRSISASCWSGRTGAKPTPQLPITTLVAPFHDDGVISGSQ